MTRGSGPQHQAQRTVNLDLFALRYQASGRVVCEQPVRIELPDQRHGLRFPWIQDTGADPGKSFMGERRIQRNDLYPFGNRIEGL